MPDVTHEQWQKLSPSRRGTIAEQRAVVWLWEQGCEVYINLDGQGIWDGSCVNPDKTAIRVFDVKSFNGEWGHDATQYLSEKQLGLKTACLLVSKTGKVQWAQHPYDPSIYLFPENIL